jgi:hypothetical protein
LLSTVEVVIVEITHEVDIGMPAETIVTELMGLLQNILTETVGSELCEMESRAGEFGRKASELAMAEMLSNQEKEPGQVACECGCMASLIGYRERTQVTLAGTHSIRRGRYRCGSCGRWIHPRDEELGIGSGNYSAGVAGLASEVAAAFPFGPCEDFLSRRFGLDLCYKQVQRISERCGKILSTDEKRTAEAVIADKADIFSSENPATLTISADGLMVHSGGAWSEMKVGTFISEYGRTSIATMGRCEEFGGYLYLEALRRGARNAGTVVFVADGAAWIWNLAIEHFEGCVEIVDWYHASEHLWQIANSWYGEGSARAKRWVKDNKERLMEDGVDRVIASIRQWKPKTEEQVETKRKNLHYFTTNAKRMLYASFEINGFHIGSGSVESACKQYGQGRLKQAGMRWKEQGIESIAHLRSALLNRRTDNILQAAKIAA